MAIIIDQLIARQVYTPSIPAKINLSVINKIKSFKIDLIKEKMAIGKHMERKRCHTPYMR